MGIGDDSKSKMKRGYEDVSEGSLPLVFDKCLDTALSLGDSHASPKLPWESSPFVAEVFGRSSVPWIQPVPTLRSVVSFPLPQKKACLIISPEKKREIVRATVRESLHKNPDTERMSVLVKWCELLMLEPDATPPGKMLLECAGDDKLLLQTLADTFRKKGTSTLKTRVGSLAMFFGWMGHSYPEESLFPIQEGKLYEYSCLCRASGKSASRIDTLLASLQFAGAQLDFPGASEAARSLRVQGVSHELLLNRPPRARAAMLQSAMLCWLEIACFAMAGVWERAMAGFILTCLYGRLRVSDANRVRHGSIIGRFVEGALSRTKTAQSKEKATAFIPLVIPTFGILGKPWFLEFLAARKELGLADVPSLKSRAHDLTFVLMPGQISLGYEVMWPVGSVEVTDHLRLFLAKGFSRGHLEGISSHSLKTTILAWMNMFGCSYEVSEILGYHVNKNHGSALNYSRDSLCSPVRQMVRMLNQVHDGAFVPEGDRESMFPQRHHRLQIEQHFELETGLTVAGAAKQMQEGAAFASMDDKRSSNERLDRLGKQYPFPKIGMLEYLTPEEEFAWNVTSPQEVSPFHEMSSDGEDVASVVSFSSSSTDEDEGPAMAMVEALNNRHGPRAPSVKCDMMLMYRHKRTKMLHYGHVSDINRTGCGRLLSESYYEFSDDADLVFPKCKHCFG